MRFSFVDIAHACITFGHKCHVVVMLNLSSFHLNNSVIDGTIACADIVLVWR